MTSQTYDNLIIHILQKHHKSYSNKFSDTQYTHGMTSLFEMLITKKPTVLKTDYTHHTITQSISQCIKIIPTLTYQQKSEILYLLYHGNVQQCIIQIKNYTKSQKYS